LLAISSKPLLQRQGSLQSASNLTTKPHLMQLLVPSMLEITLRIKQRQQQLQPPQPPAQLSMDIPA
jgi:hypothetical protein